MQKLKHFLKVILFHLKQTGYSMFGSKVECNICHYKAQKLNSDIWHQYSVCPKCWSGVRQRLLWAVLNDSKDWHIEKLISNKRVLHFAPEKVISKLIEPLAAKYTTADYLADGYIDAYYHIDYNMDISNMHQLENNEYDCIIACDVLEHVSDDKKALRDVFRVLDNGGYCIFTVPQKDNLAITFEDLSITKPKEREEKFGQSDHLRIYGDDFLLMIEQAGFKAVQIDEYAFNEGQRNKNVLFPPTLSDHPLATNYRKIFVGHKA